MIGKKMEKRKEEREGKEEGGREKQISAFQTA